MRRTTRSMTLGDAIVLVAATAAGLVGWRFWAWANRGYYSFFRVPMDRNSFLGGGMSARSAIPYASAPLLGWTLAILVLGILADRDRPRRLWTRPGFLACFAALLANAWRGLDVAMMMAIVRPTMMHTPATNPVRLGPTFGFAFQFLSPSFSPYQCVGLAVVLVWVVSWGSGRCRMEPSWLDRLGRLLGLAWILISVINFRRL